VSSVPGYFVSGIAGQIKKVDEFLYNTSNSKNEEVNPKMIFIVHGHDDIRFKLAHWLTKNKLNCFFLDDKTSQSMTIIQKLEHYSPKADFAIVLMTADDIGKEKNYEGGVRPRARQNVMLELGYFIGKIGRNKVHVIAHENIEIPSDWSGVINSRISNGILDFEAICQDLVGAGFILQY